MLTKTSITLYLINLITPHGQFTLGCFFMLMWHHCRTSIPRSGEKDEEANTSTLQSKGNNINNHFNSFSSPRAKPMI